MMALMTCIDAISLDQSDGRSTRQLRRVRIATSWAQLFA